VIASLHEAFLQAVQKPDPRRFPSRLLRSLAEYLEASALVVLRGAADGRLHIADATGDAIAASEEWSAGAEEHLDRKLQRILRPLRGARVSYLPLLHRGTIAGILAASLPASRSLRDLQIAASLWSLAAFDVEEDLRWNDRVDIHLRNHYRLQGWAEMARGLQHHIQQMVEVQESSLEMLLRGHAELNGSPVVQTLVNSLHELRRMVIRLRQFNRLVSATPTFRPISLAALVRLAIQRKRTSDPTARFRMWQHSKTLLPTEPDVLADPESLLPCISELLQNAVEYGSGQPVAVEISCQAGMVTLAVRNSGSMTPTVQQHVFDLFYTTQPDPSRGLGLSIALAIALLHRGSIYTTTSSRHTTVYLALPLMHP
jgi:signal transduction histidine kinase